MEPKDFRVVDIEGEYAKLAEVKDGVALTGDEVFIALALLPMGVDVGSLLHWEMFEYTLIKQ